MKWLNGIISLWKTLLTLFVIAFFWFYGAKFLMFPYDVKQGRLIEERKEASFLNLNESIVLELNDKFEYEEIQNVEKDELGKEELFDTFSKNDYRY